MPASTMRADLVARTAAGLVHVEFVKDPKPDLDLRMIEYRVRLRRRDRTVPLTQTVLLLRDVRVPIGYHDVDGGALTASWRVVRLGELDPSELLRTPTTAALAALARGTSDERAGALLAAAGLIAGSAAPGRRELLLSAAATLASIVLPRRTIDTTLEEAAMPVLIRDTPLGRELFEEARAEGLEAGRAEGRADVQRFTAVLLRARFGADPRIDGLAADLAELPAEERATRLTTAATLDELVGA